MASHKRSPFQEKRQFPEVRWVKDQFPAVLSDLTKEVILSKEAFVPGRQLGYNPISHLMKRPHKRGHPYKCSTPIEGNDGLNPNYLYCPTTSHKRSLFYSDVPVVTIYRFGVYNQVV